MLPCDWADKLGFVAGLKVALCGNARVLSNGIIAGEPADIVQFMTLKCKFKSNGNQVPSLSVQQKQDIAMFVVCVYSCSCYLNTDIPFVVHASPVYMYGSCVV